MTDEDGNPIGARVGQNTNQGNNRSEVSVYAWVIGFFVACFVGWYFFIKSDDEEKCGTGFILENGKCVAVKMADPVTVPPGSVPLITPTGIVAVPAGPVNMPVVNVPPVSKTCDTGFILENGTCVAVKMADPGTVPPVWRFTKNADASTGPVNGTWASGVRGLEDCKIACQTANCRSISFHKPDGACLLHQPHDKFRVNERVGEFPYDVYENPMYL